MKNSLAFVDEDGRVWVIDQGRCANPNLIAVRDNEAWVLGDEDDNFERPVEGQWPLWALDALLGKLFEVGAEIVVYYPNCESKRVVDCERMACET